MERRFDAGRKEKAPLFAEETRFLRSLLVNPKKTGALSPSGRPLARAMAQAIGAVREGLVIELGPGTGPVTRALLEHGVPKDRLVLVEYEPGFCRLLQEKFASVRVLRGDAYDLPQTLKDLRGLPIQAIVSSLPLLNENRARRAQLLEDAFELMGPDGVFVQFTYGFASPMPQAICTHRFAARRRGPIWRNVPPAHVWTYHADPSAVIAVKGLEGLRRRADEIGDEIGERLASARADAEKLLRKHRARMRLTMRKTRGIVAKARAFGDRPRGPR